MKRVCKVMLLSGVFLISLCLLPSYSNAQIGDPGDDPDAPIDGGISLLLAAGVGYGVKRVRANRKEKMDISDKHKA